MKSASAPISIPLLPAERRFPPMLLVFVALSFLAHATTFFLFQVAYPPRVTIPPAATQVALLTGQDPAQQALLRWIESEDPALVAASAHPVPARLFEMEYRPSYLTPRTAPRTMPEVAETTERPPGPELGLLLRSVAPNPPASPNRVLPAGTRLVVSGKLAARSIATPPKLRPAAPGTLEDAAFLLGVDGEGEVLYTLLQKSSGDRKTDCLAQAEIARMRFVPTEGEIAWGFASVIWGDTETAPNAPK